MATEHQLTHGARLGTVWGTAFTVAGTIGSSDLIKTATLATLGAIVSFTVTMLLTWIKKRME